MSRLKRLHQHLKTNLLWYSLIAIGLGLGIGHQSLSFISANQKPLANLIIIVVFMLIYPMMVNLRLEFLAKAFKNIKALILTLFYNFLWAPLLGYALSNFFLTNPEVGLGFFLVMAVPCSSMSIGYTGLAEGNLELAIATVALSFVLTIPALPLWLEFLGGSFHIPIPINVLFMSILKVLIAPMICGYITRIILIRVLGEEKFKKINIIFPIMTMLSLFLIIFLIFFMKAKILLQQWQIMLWLIVPNLIFMIATLGLITWLDKACKLSYEDHMGLVFASTGKNNGTAIAIATTAFSPLVAVPAATLPIFQIVFLILYLKMENTIRRYFGSEKRETLKEEKLSKAEKFKAKMFKKILAAVDFSKNTERVIQVAINLAKGVSNELYLISVLEPEEEILEESYEPAGVSTVEWESELRKQENRIKYKKEHLLVMEGKEIEENGIKAHLLFYEGDPREKIVQAAKRIEASLIVMGSHSRRSFEDVILGTTTQRVIKEAPCPVLVVPYLK